MTREQLPNRRPQASETITWGGHRIVELRADRAIIKARPGALQAFRRWPRQVSPEERLPIWKLATALDNTRS